MNGMSISLCVVYHSGYGHTTRLAQAVADGAANEQGVNVELISADSLADNESDWAKLDAADALIFGCPTYMGGPSAPFKAFMDASSARWMEFKWADKIAAGFTNSGSLSGDKLNTLVSLAVFAAQHGMIWVNLNVPPGNNSSQGSPRDLNRIRLITWGNGAIERGSGA
jgi:multimeric flavodoxin WrbA